MVPGCTICGGLDRQEFITWIAQTYPYRYSIPKSSICISQAWNAAQTPFYQGLSFQFLIEHPSPIMTTLTTSTDYAHEKQEVEYAEHAKASPVESSYELQKERTLEGIDMNNSYAVKGDDSDGKVEWNVRSAFAAVFLAALYTGTHAVPNSCYTTRANLSRLSGHSLLHWRLAWVHRGRSRSFSWLSLAANS
jgi:hypothetical protein